MEEGLSPEHGRELLRHALPDLLDGGGVAHEGGGHLEPLGRDVADGGLHVVGDPLHEVRRVLVHHVQHLPFVVAVEGGGKQKGSAHGTLDILVSSDRLQH